MRVNDMTTEDMLSVLREEEQRYRTEVDALQRAIAALTAAGDPIADRMRSRLVVYQMLLGAVVVIRERTERI